MGTEQGSGPSFQTETSYTVLSTFFDVSEPTSLAFCFSRSLGWATSGLIAYKLVPLETIALLQVLARMMMLVLVFFLSAFDVCLSSNGCSHQISKFMGW